ncbi:hypothetical protein [Mycoplasma wenyonii]|nr:hypothetical protein [Mycoplasma wenyonii]
MGREIRKLSYLWLESREEKIIDGVFYVTGYGKIDHCIGKSA